MSFFDFDSQIEQTASLFTDGFGEQVTYTPLGGVARTINAVVDRNPPDEIDGVPGSGATGVVRVFVRRHATLGTTSVNTGGDSFSIAPRYGGTARPFKVVSIVSQDAGGFTLLLRGPSA